MPGKARDGHEDLASDAAGPVTLATDPVCGMKVDPATSEHRLGYGGTTYHFCSAGCRTKFAANPGSYLKPKVAAMAPAPAGAIYTCPMHPQIRQVGPGSCPICGMALEPVEVSAEAQPNHELADMSRRFWIGLVLTLPVFILEMGSHIPGLGLHDLVPPAMSTWVQFALATPVVLWAGWPFFQRGWASVRSGHLNMFTLIALGTGAAYLYSLAATFVPGAFPAGFHTMGGMVPVYYEAAAVITVLVLLGQVLELRARDQTGGAIRALLNLASKTARRLRAGRPVLVVPHGAGTPRLDHAMIGWKDTRETRRAVADALPLLQKMTRVTVAEVAGTDDLAAARSHVGDVAGWLARHGVAADTLAAPRDGDDAAQLDAIARDRGADLVVAGAYGHSRLREWALGGVTRSLLRHADRCSLLSH